MSQAAQADAKSNILRPSVHSCSCSWSCLMQLFFSSCTKEIRCQLLWKPPQSFLVFCSSRPLYVCMLSTPVIIDIQNKDVLIFNWVELSSSAERFSDLPVGSALLPYTLLFPYCRSPFPCLFISKVIFACSATCDAETTPFKRPTTQLKFPMFCMLFLFTVFSLVTFFNLFFFSHQLALALPPIKALLIQTFQ